MSNSTPFAPVRPVGIRRRMTNTTKSRCPWGIAFILIFCGAIPLMGQSKPQPEPHEFPVVAAQAFVLKDASGKERGELSLKEGIPSLSLMDQNGVCRIRLGMNPDDGSPLIMLFDEEGDDRGLLRVNTAGEPRLVLERADADPEESLPPALVENDQTPTTGPIASAKPVQPSRAATRLFAQHCASCHDEDGSGSSARSDLPRLPDFRAAAWQTARTDARLLVSIIHGRGTDMPPFRGELTDAQARDLLGVVRAFGPERRSVSPASGGDFGSQFQALEREFQELEQRLQGVRRASPRR